ncbi:nitroreductase family protein [Anaerovorax odorimutans]|uniref:Nitroreductase family protein n=1 Tax=Anaerovorax odorimutans TaxID=109327 RepID=A0ABT1RM89_9FIRM|nr:nitroreductase family protein [Anaerovorax odorimutans]MCQ4636305.1 nitroreductase family protein [Anaerovorax odorimutans]
MIDKLTQRRSIRKYTEEAIPEEKLKTVLKAGLLSPTSKNLHPWEFLVVQDRKLLGELADCREMGADMLKGAAAAVIVMADTQINDVWIEDCSIAMSNMHLTAADEGVGSCWIQVRNRNSKKAGVTTEQFIKEMFDIGEKYAVEAILSLGMPAKERGPVVLDEKLWEKVHYGKF